MFQATFKLVKIIGVVAAVLFLAAGVFDPLQTFLALNTVKGLTILGCVLACALLLDKHLGRLAFNEAAKELENVSYEELVAASRNQQRGKK